MSTASCLSPGCFPLPWDLPAVCTRSPVKPTWQGVCPKAWCAGMGWSPCSVSCQLGLQQRAQRCADRGCPGLSPVGIACIALTFVDETGSPTTLPHGERPGSPKVPIVDLLQDADFESLTAVSKHQPEAGTQHTGRMPLHPPQHLRKVWVLS